MLQSILTLKRASSEVEYDKHIAALGSTTDLEVLSATASTKR